MTLLGVWAHRAARRPGVPVGRSEGGGAAAVRDSGPELSRTRRAVAGAVVGGVVLIGAVGANQGAKNGDVYDVVKGGAIGVLAGSALSVFVSCAALRRPQHWN